MEADEERLRNQREFRELLEKLGITQAQAAELIKEKTNQDVTPRKVRTWLASPKARSARTLPNWALTAIKGAAQKD
ncbi:MAG: hypothetical protein HOO93_04995 [Methyloglobulus sp.]|nr:hypothetical protein [Methyloglobulus sp.]